MCDQSKKAACPGTPASRVAREIFPVDYQILQCYNEDAGNDTRELAQKGDATCDTVKMRQHENLVEKIISFTDDELKEFTYRAQQELNLQFLQEQQPCPRPKA